MLVDGLDVYYFSELCNPVLSSNDEKGNKNLNPYYEYFLQYNYILGADIDYEDAAKTFKMLRPIGWGDKGKDYDHTFHGTFDGRGYTIKNIFFSSFKDQEEYEKYYLQIIGKTTELMTQIAWFVNNSGTIKNLGIINPTIIQYFIYEGNMTISPFIGQNLGIVQNCYVQDLRGTNSGIAADGGYEMSMFASFNASEAIIDNCYVASDRISSTSVQMTTTEKRHPFIVSNYGTITNCYYDGTILNKNNNSYNDKINISEQTKKNDINKISTKEFNTNKFNYASGVWYSNVTYDSKYIPYMHLKYPVLKGLKQDNSKSGFIINSAVDLVYMSELIDKYQIFRSATYYLTNSVDLRSVKENAFVFTDKIFNGTFKGKIKDESEKLNDTFKVKLTDNSLSKYYSIINLNINKGVSYESYHCYGLFGILGGTIENVNIVNTTINQEDLTTLNYNEINTIGTVCGLLVDNGEINNVNVFSTIDLNRTSNDNKNQINNSVYLGKEYVGGICGTTLNGKINGCTTSGEILPIVYSSADTVYDNSIGGIVGKSINNKGIQNCLNNILINVPTYDFQGANNYRQYIGGIIGSGSLCNTHQIQNNGDIKIPKDNYYSIVYAGGIIGRVENVIGKENNGQFLNNANIEYTVNDNNYKAYISGIMNLISEVANSIDKFKFKNNELAGADDEERSQIIQNKIDELPVFEFSSLTNSGTIIINNELESIQYPAKYQVINGAGVTDGIDIRTAGICYSYLTNYNVNGAYNLKIHYERNIETGKIIKVDNNPQEIDFSIVDEFAPTFNADNKVILHNNYIHYETNVLKNKSDIYQNNSKVESKINLEKVYNERNINYITNNDVNSYMLQLSGCLNGVNYNLNNIRNTGDIKVYFTNSAYKNMKLNEIPYYNYFCDFKKIKVYGVMEEVSIGYRAKNIYNGGNITISSKKFEYIYDESQKREIMDPDNIISNFNIYASGICYKNIGNDDTSNQKLMIEKGYVGSMHNCVNNGSIRITNGDIINDNPKCGGKFYGQSCLSGIACINCSTISSSLNLGDIYNINDIADVNNDEYNICDKNGIKLKDFKIETGGFCYLMQNEELDTYKAGTNEKNITLANIIDSANNGKIISMNTRNNEGYVNIGGFACRNDSGEDDVTTDMDDSLNKQPYLQKIEYSINYGDIYAYNNNGSWLDFDEQYCKGAGFVCLGACRVVDVINYGSIYGSGEVAGIFGFLYMNRMVDSGLNIKNPIYIANAINYGNIQNISNENEKDKNAVSDAILNGESVDSKYYIEETYISQVTTKRVTGAFIGMISNLATKLSPQDALKTLNIRNLVNFDNTINMLGAIDQTPLVFNDEKDKELLNEFMENMATTNPKDTSPTPFKTDRVNFNYGIKAYYKNTNKGRPRKNIYSQVNNGGIFNRDFVLRNAPDYKLDENGNIDSNITDNFIADYIQFIPYSKVNDALIEKIGLSKVIFDNAVNQAEKNLMLINTILKQKNSSSESMNNVYNQIMKEIDVNLSTSKNEIVSILKQELSSDKYSFEEIKSIFNSLSKYNDAFKNIFKFKDVVDLIESIVDKLSSQEVEKLFIELYSNDENFISILANSASNFKKYIDLLSENDLNYNILKTIFNALVSEEGVEVGTISSLIRNLTLAEKKELANGKNGLFNLLQNNKVVRESLLRFYPNLNISNQKDANNLQNVINNNINNLTDSEYKEIYKELKISSKTNNVINAIENLTLNQLKTFIDSLINEVGKNYKLHNFIDNGLKKTANIYLPASKANHFNIVNSDYTKYYKNDLTNEFTDENHI